MKNHSTSHFNHRFRRLAAALLALVAVFTFCFSGSAEAESAIRYVEETDVTGTVYTVTTTAISTIYKPFTQTQAEHRKGIQTTIGVSQTLSLSVAASASIAATVGIGYADVTLALCVELGIAQTSTVEIGTSVSYTIPATEEDGLYRIEAVFPRYSTRFYIYTYGADGITVVKDKTISKVPSQRDAYYKINRYSDIID